MTPHKKRKKIIDDKTYTIQCVKAETEGCVVCGLLLFKIRPQLFLIHLIKTHLCRANSLHFLWKKAPQLM